MTEESDIYAQVTPNPNTLKFVVNKSILPEALTSLSFDKVDNRIPIVSDLFAIDTVEAVMIGQTFISVTKKPGAQWGDMAETVTRVIKAGVASPLIPDAVYTSVVADFENQKEEEESDIIQRIKHILDDEIRPAVAMDGGDVQFKSFDNGILTLQLQGACSSCPSATFTLKMGIENRLKEDIPEIVSVVQDGVADLF